MRGASAGDPGQRAGGATVEQRDDPIIARAADGGRARRRAVAPARPSGARPIRTGRAAGRAARPMTAIFHGPQRLRVAAWYAAAEGGADLELRGRARARGRVRLDA
ncbi:MAG: hypothetical protein MZW92_35150 [Comamonadaceae bacterium]|nr:hypothetical protein [Comamonadaceae bacterium]